VAQVVLKQAREAQALLAKRAPQVQVAHVVAAAVTVYAQLIAKLCRAAKAIAAH
jgi:hypothetical protein